MPFDMARAIWKYLAPEKNAEEATARASDAARTRGPSTRSPRETMPRKPSSARRARASSPKPGASLEEYRTKRDFVETSEPRGARGSGRKRAAAHALRYVIQKHAARSLHYDFRLELDGVLLSWAVPKGPSLDPAVKRLAVETEPHPLEYAAFEGEIPRGQYGAGTVRVWDHGSWQPRGDAREGYANGRLSFTLEGERLHGTWHLIRTGGQGRPRRGVKNWLLFKGSDAQLEPGELEAAALPGARKGRLGRRVEPELATLVDAAPEGDEWLHELKFDGYRVIARLEHGRVRLFTRGGKDWTRRMPGVAQAVAGMPLERALFDGEVVVLDEHGVSNFQRLQNSLSGEAQSPLAYFVFDLLHLNGVELRGVPLAERKALLARVFEAAPRGATGTLRLSEHVAGQGPEFFQRACRRGLEGIVSKRASAPYRAGRGGDWLKVKCSMRQEFVIVGYSEPAGSRQHLGALLLGLERDGALEYVGRVGTGFDAASLRELHRKLGSLETDASSLSHPPRGAHARGVHWVKPRLVAEAAFTGFTERGLLRHPTFQGLREDKPARRIELERPTQTRPERRYPISHPDKVLYPEQGITKQELLDHYARVAERMLPHVRHRPLTLLRCPNGRSGACFFQKHPGGKLPEGIRTLSIREKSGKAEYCVIDDERGLFALVQLGVLEIHTWGSRADDLERPDLLVFDLDPDPALEFEAVIGAARRLRQFLAALELESFVKTTGGKGLHVCVPVRPDLTWPDVKAFARQTARALAAEAPESYLTSASKAQRKHKIFIDYLRNARGATFVAPYSTRARPGAPVAQPLEWRELTPKLRPSELTLRALEQRPKARDPFARLLTLEQDLRKARARAAG